jgi:cysteine desulfuration protein SufE
MTIKDKMNSYKEELNMFDDNIEKYQYIMEKGKSVGTTLTDDLKNDTFKVQGCQSQVWLVPIRDGEVINYSSDSDAFITKGVVSIIADIYSGSTPKEIVESKEDLTTELQFGTILSGQRRNGAYNMLLKIKEYAKLWA